MSTTIINAGSKWRVRVEPRTLYLGPGEQITYADPVVINETTVEADVVAALIKSNNTDIAEVE